MATLPASLRVIWWKHVEETSWEKTESLTLLKAHLTVHCASGHLSFQLLIVVGGEGGAAVLRDIHLVHYLGHPLPQLVALLSGQQPVQNHISFLQVLSGGRREMQGRDVCSGVFSTGEIHVVEESFSPHT